MEMLRPVQNNEREIFMDVLRGFAILGIFIANLHAFSWWEMADSHATGAMLLPAYDNKMNFLHHIFIEGKFYSIFSFLFGWGVALQVMRAEHRESNAVSLVRRRLFFMLLLGACHLLLWPGDIVFFYALLGFILLPLRRFSNKTLIITSVVLLFSPILLYVLKMHFPVLRAPSAILFGTGDFIDQHLNGINSEETFVSALKNAGWFDIIKMDLAGFFYRYGDLFFQSRIPKVLGMMLLGLVAGRTNFYRNFDQHKKILYWILIAGLMIGLPANFILGKYMISDHGDYNQFKINGLYRTIAYAVGVAPLAASYIAGFMLLFKTKLGAKILSPFAAVGKMAFSNYIMHTLIGNFVFLNAGLGYMAKVGPVYYTLFAFIVFAFQVLFSTVWLRYFNYGPLEWLWRSATYKKWQQMVKGTP